MKAGRVYKPDRVPAPVPDSRVTILKSELVNFGRFNQFVLKETCDEHGAFLDQQRRTLAVHLHVLDIRRRELKDEARPARSALDLKIIDRVRIFDDRGQRISYLSAGREQTDRQERRQQHNRGPFLPGFHWNPPIPDLQPPKNIV